MRNPSPPPVTYDLVTGTYTLAGEQVGQHTAVGMLMASGASSVEAVAAADAARAAAHEDRQGRARMHPLAGSMVLPAGDIEFGYTSAGCGAALPELRIYAGGLAAATIAPHPASSADDLDGIAQALEGYATQLREAARIREAVEASR